MTKRRTTRTLRILPMLSVAATLCVAAACDRGTNDVQSEPDPASMTSADEERGTQADEGNEQGEDPEAEPTTEPDEATETEQNSDGFGVTPETMRGEGRPPVTIIGGQPNEPFNLGMRRLSPPEIAPIPMPTPRSGNR